MVNFNVKGLEGLEQLDGLGAGELGSFLASFGAIAFFMIILVVIAFVVLWVFSSIGLMNQAKKMQAEMEKSQEESSKEKKYSKCMACFSSSWT